MKNFLRQHQKAFIVLAIFLLLTAVSGFYASRPAKNNFTPAQTSQAQPAAAPNQPLPEPPAPTSVGQTPAAATSAVPPAPAVNKTTAPDVTASAPQATGQTHILYVGQTKYEIAVPAASTVYDLMLALQQRGDLEFQGQAWPGLGFFVQAINNVKNAGGNYWFYYINGQSANVGITNYILKANDIINWQYEKSKF